VGNCHDLVDGLAFGFVLRFDDRSTPAAPTPAPQPLPVLIVPVVAPVDVAKPAPSPAGRVLVGASGLLGLATTPAPAGGGIFAIGWRAPWWSVSGEVRALLTLNAPVDGGHHVSLHRVTGAALPCLHWRFPREVRGCAREAGQAHRARPCEGLPRSTQEDRSVFDCGWRHPVKVRSLLLVSVCVLGLQACAADYLDLGYDHAAIGAGGAAGSGSQLCTPGEKRECYAGPEGTKGEGICKPGEEMCNAEGSAFGACEGETLPKPADDCTTIEDEDCDGNAPPCSGTVLWAQRFEDGSAQLAQGVTVDASGNVIVTGNFHGSVNFGGETIENGSGGFSGDIFAAKFAPDATHLWSTRFGSETSQRARAVTVDGAESIIIAGDFDGSIDFGDGTHSSAGGADVFLAKLDPSGATLWSKSFANNGPKDYGLASDPFGNVILAGAFDQTIDFGGNVAMTSGGGLDMFIAKFNPTGVTQWAKRFGDAGLQLATSVAGDTTGNVLVTGHLSGAVDVGTKTLTSAGAEDVVLVKLAP